MVKGYYNIAKEKELREKKGKTLIMGFSGLKRCRRTSNHFHNVVTVVKVPYICKHNEQCNYRKINTEFSAPYR